MMNYLPPYYRTSRVMQHVMDTEEVEYKNIQEEIENIFQQFFVKKATWGLDIYEEELGLSPDECMPVEERRSRILAKKRGDKKLDKKQIQAVCLAYTNGEVEVWLGEDDKLHIKFISTKGIPKGYSELCKVMEDIHPYYIDLLWEYSYYLIKDIHNVMTINELQQTKLHKFAGGA